MYQFVAAQSKVLTAPTRRSEPLDSSLMPADWSATLVRRMYAESPRHMRSILDALASRADEWVRADELIEVLSKSRGGQATSATLGGTLGAFGRRVKNRYRMKSWPLDVVKDADIGQLRYRVSSAVADLLSAE